MLYHVRCAILFKINGLSLKQILKIEMVFCIFQAQFRAQCKGIVFNLLINRLLGGFQIVALWEFYLKYLIY